MIKRRYMRTRQLKPGMIIDQVIKDPTGRNLVVQGSAIDDYIISSLLKLGIMSVYIREGNADPDDPDAILSPKAAAMVKQLRTDDRSKVTLSDSVRQRVSTGVQYIFNNTNSEELTQATNQIADSLMEAINENDAIAVDISSLKTSDEYTFKHSVDVATISMILAKQMKLTDNEIHDIGVSGLLHDIGKTMIPNEILNKPGRLTDDEFNIMKKHSVYGYNMLKDRKDLNNSILMGVLQHHERIDGTGYPLGFDAPKIHFSRWKKRSISEAFKNGYSVRIKADSSFWRLTGIFSFTPANRFTFSSWMQIHTIATGSP